MSIFKIKEKKMFLCLILGIALSICLNVLFSLIKLDRIFPTYSTEVKPFLFRLPLAAGLILYGILAPILEEIIFRWGFFKRLCIYVTAQAAGAGSAIIFGIYHGNAIQFIYAFIFGLILAYVYWRFENLLSSVMVHSAANCTVYIMYFLPTVALFNNTGIRVLIVLLSGVVSIAIMMYFLNTSGPRDVMPEKPFFPRRM